MYDISETENKFLCLMSYVSPRQLCQDKYYVRRQIENR